jgi:hypothetical protein
MPSATGSFLTAALSIWAIFSRAPVRLTRSPSISPSHPSRSRSRSAAASYCSCSDQPGESGYAREVVSQ